MNDLIAIKTNDQQQPVVSGRDLHEFLGVGTEYAKWFERMTDYGFSSGTDFSSVLTESTGGRPATDHAITLDMAKELCMIQRTERGKIARQHFIAVEKEWNSPEKVMARALLMANAELQRITHTLEISAPKIEGFDRFMSAAGFMDMNETAKALGVGRNRLFAFLRRKHVLMVDNMPYQEHMNAGRFKVIEQTCTDSSKSVHISRKTLVSAKGLDYIRRLLDKDGAN